MSTHGRGLARIHPMQFVLVAALILEIFCTNSATLNPLLLRPKLLEFLLQFGILLPQGFVNLLR